MQPGRSSFMARTKSMDWNDLRYVTRLDCSVCEDQVLDGPASGDEGTEGGPNIILAHE